MHEEFMAFVRDDASFRTARAVVESRGWEAACVQQGGLDLLADMLESAAPPKILLLDLDGEGDVMGAATRALDVCGPDCRVIFLASLNDINLYRQFVKLGAADYIVKPMPEEVLAGALQHAARPVAAPAAAKEKTGEARVGKIIPIMGAHGGVGATTLAVNLAAAMAGPLGLHVGLIDLDMHFGSCALALDKEPGRGMRAALENPERLDGLLIASSMVEALPRLSILCSEEPLDAPLYVSGDATMALMKPVAQDFDVILVDLPRAMMLSQKRLLTEAHDMVLVCDLTLASLRDVRRIRAFMKNLKPDLMPMLVANHTGDTAYATLDQATFEKNAEAKFDMLLPEDARAAKQAANLGKALLTVAPESVLAKNIVSLARLLTGIREEKKVAESKGFGALLKGLGKNDREKGEGKK